MPKHIKPFLSEFPEALSKLHDYLPIEKCWKCQGKLVLDQGNRKYCVCCGSSNAVEYELSVLSYQSIHDGDFVRWNAYGTRQTNQVFEMFELYGHDMPKKHNGKWR